MPILNSSVKSGMVFAVNVIAFGGEGYIVVSAGLTTVQKMEPDANHGTSNVSMGGDEFSINGFGPDGGILLEAGRTRPSMPWKFF